MNRPRKQNRELPACVYLKCGTYYYVKKNKWRNLGKDKKAALTEYVKLLAAPTDGLAGLFSRWLNGMEMSENTRAAYTRATSVVLKAFKEFEPHEITARDIMAFLHHHRSQPSSANSYRTVLIGALDLAFIENIVERNVARDTRPYKIKARDRYLSDEEFSAIREKAKPVLRAIMDVLYLTGQRISDVLAIRHSDLTDQGILFKQQKTGHRMVVSWSTELRVAVTEAKKTSKNIKGMTLFSNRKGKTWDYATISQMWRDAAALARVDDCRIHDIRAKAATDAKNQGVDGKALLGHQSESSHQRYLRSKETTVATPVSFRKT